MVNYKLHPPLQEGAPEELDGVSPANISLFYAVFKFPCCQGMLWKRTKAFNTVLGPRDLLNHKVSCTDTLHIISESCWLPSLSNDFRV